MTEKIFETALSIATPWYGAGVDLDAEARTLTIRIDFVKGSRFALPGEAGAHPVHDTVSKRFRPLNFFQHECYLEVRVPRVKRPDGSVRQVEPCWVGRLSGFTLLFEALVLALCQQMTFSGVARLVNLSLHRVMAICVYYVERVLAQADFSEVRQLAIDETSRTRGHDYVTLAADAERRAVLFVTEGRGAETVEALAADLVAHGADPDAIESVSIDMSPRLHQGHRRTSAQRPPHLRQVPCGGACLDGAGQDAPHRTEDRPRSQGTALDAAQGSPASEPPVACADLDALLAHMTSKRTARDWLYREQLREILDRKQINVVRTMLGQWCTNVMRSKVEPMKEVAHLIRRHIEGIVAWAQTRQANGFLEALNGLFQAAKRKARGYGRITTIRTVIFLLAGKLDFSKLNPHVAC